MLINQFEKSSISNQTLAQQIADTIAVQTIDGQYKPGERLFEMKLTESFGTSRAPIREALYILEKEGVVERIPRRGVFIKSYTSKELFDLYDVIYRLEEIALEKCCDSISENQINHLNEIIVRMEEAAEKEELRNYFDYMEKLQLSFFDISQNEILKEVYLNLIVRISRLRFISLSHNLSLENSLIEYKNIIEGLKAQDFQQVKFHLKRKENRALEIWKEKGF